MKRLALSLLLFASVLLAGGLASSVSAGTTIGSKRSASSVMPQSTIRQQIVDKTILRLARIRIVNGFATDIGLGLASDKQKSEADSPASITGSELGEHGRFGIFDGENIQTQESTDEGMIPSDLNMQVRWFHPADWDAKGLRVAIGDIKKALIEDESTGERDATFDGLLTGIRPVRDGFVRPQETFEVDACAVEFTAPFLAEPFSDYL